MNFDRAKTRAEHDLQDITTDLQAARNDETEPSARALLADVLSFVEDVAADKDLFGASPEKSFERGLALLSEGERRLFMVRNALEAVKRGDDPRKTIAHYQRLGLIRTEVPQPDAQTLEEIKEFQPPTARAAMWISKKFSRVLSVLSCLTIEAARAIPKLGKFKAGLTFVGGVPCPSFVFETDSAEWDISELWDRVSAAYKK